MPEANPPAREPLLEHPGRLIDCIERQTQLARQRGALHSVPTEFETIEQGGIPFTVRVLAHLAQKDRARQSSQRAAGTARSRDPFLPYERDLFVADISATHACLLNKYNVMERHLLLVTRAFESQQNWLTASDFEALGACLAEVDGLGFYNAGEAAGASQPHKHLQLVPLPLAPQGPPVPIEPAIEAAPSANGAVRLPHLPFPHAFMRLDPSWTQAPTASSASVLERYQRLMRALGFSPQAGLPSPPYNLLAARDWMLAVPRCQGSVAGIEINALGFAGALLVRDHQQLERLQARGPLAVLQATAGTTRGSPA
ncbi:MAG: phosphorylase [Cyanobacteria bacterium QS_8_64_29]|nr:MAG: phosphorylase [Cyanobacteria bacterium QS_8_64_29]